MCGIHPANCCVDEQVHKGVSRYGKLISCAAIVLTARRGALRAGMKIWLFRPTRKVIGNRGASRPPSVGTAVGRHREPRLHDQLYLLERLERNATEHARNGDVGWM